MLVRTAHPTGYTSTISFIMACLLITACSGPQKGLFSSNKTPHEKYADRLKQAGLATTALGQLWLNAAGKGLAQPAAISLPYNETGYFDAASPSVAGYRFTARRGDQLQVELVKKPVTGFTLFLDLWQPQENGEPRLLTAADTVSHALNYEVKKDGTYLLRLQPELLSSGGYTLTIKTGPSLGFPVSGASHPRIGSFWGDVRDAGARSHEGIDIFGAFRTPVVAAADGYVTSVTTNRLGGKVVFMRPDDKDYVLYYAHLDSQLVQQGQRVRQGDTLGLMGNTGNARTTPTHLHFGIYALGGAINPLPFVNRNRAAAAAITAPVNNLNALLRTNRKTILQASPDKKAEKLRTTDEHTLVQVKAVTDDWYKVQLPDGTEGFVPADNTASISKPLRSYTLPVATPLLNKPDSTAAAKTRLEKGKKIPVVAVYNDYYYVTDEQATGWLAK